MNYETYTLSLLDKGKLVVITLAGTAVIGILFYNSLWIMLVTPLVYWAIRKQVTKAKITEQKKKLTQEFLDVMRVVLASVLAGYSIENAWMEAQKELEMLYGKASMMYLELEEMNRAIALQVPLEELLLEFAERSGIDDVISFADVFAFAKRTGGDLVHLMETTTEHIVSKNETLQEIELMVAAKQYEQKVMNAIPIFMILYLRFTSEGYLDVLYGNVLGGLIMTIALLLYGISIYWAKRIMNIDV